MRATRSFGQRPHDRGGERLGMGRKGEEQGEEADADADGEQKDADGDETNR